ncbi:hypothetical protein L3Q67_01860 [Saccharothrix sp. AJ9571]|nr:hypothetical protein L3Q67_01860 [Saccharothrix sp. AJ9571]
MDGHRNPLSICSLKPRGYGSHRFRAAEAMPRIAVVSGRGSGKRQERPQILGMN